MIDHVLDRATAIKIVRSTRGCDVLEAEAWLESHRDVLEARKDDSGRRVHRGSDAWAITKSHGYRYVSSADLHGALGRDPVVQTLRAARDAVRARALSALPLSADPIPDDVVPSTEAQRRVFGLEDTHGEEIRRARALLSRARAGVIATYAIARPGLLAPKLAVDRVAIPWEVWREESVDTTGEEIAALFGHVPPDWMVSGGAADHKRTNTQRFMHACARNPDGGIARVLFHRACGGWSFDYWLGFSIAGLRAHAPDVEGAAAGALLAPLAAVALVEEQPPIAGSIADRCRWALERCDRGRKRVARQIAEECARRWPWIVVTKSGTKGWALRVQGEDAKRRFEDVLGEMRSRDDRGTIA